MKSTELDSSDNRRIIEDPLKIVQIATYDLRIDPKGIVSIEYKSGEGSQIVIIVTYKDKDKDKDNSAKHYVKDITGNLKLLYQTSAVAETADKWMPKFQIAAIVIVVAATAAWVIYNYHSSEPPEKPRDNGAKVAPSPDTPKNTPDSKSDTSNP